MVPHFIASSQGYPATPLVQGTLMARGNGEGCVCSSSFARLLMDISGDVRTTMHGVCIFFPWALTQIPVKRIGVH